MDENNEVLEYSDVYMTEEENDVNVIETVEIIDVSDVPTYTVDSDVAFPAIGETNEYLNHNLLNGKELPDQHPITAITGLRNELDNIEALQTVYSDKKQLADYYEWADGNVSGEDRVGYFVCVCNSLDTIEICSGEDMFGVTVDVAAFVGGQDDVARDYKYGLVVHSGIVDVRCELDVYVGNYVISNEYGIAKKSNSNYGCKVIAIKDLHGVPYSTIMLGVSDSQVFNLGNDVTSLDKRMSNAETNITAAINVANKAQQNVEEIAQSNKETVEKVEDISGKVDDAVSKVESYDEQVHEATRISVEAKASAESAVNSAITAKDESIAAANNAWAKSDSVAKELYSLTANIDQYSVGEYSQAYGLTLEQAMSILKAGMVYVPTKHLNSETHDETYEPEQPYYFTAGSYYEWNGMSWTEHLNSVAFFSEEPAPSRALQYWYIDSNNAPEGYEAHALYRWENEQWIKVNTLAGNVNNRTTAMIRQTTNSILAEVVNARGSAATLGVRIDETEASANQTASWAKGSDVDGTELYNLATVVTEANDDGSTLSLVVADSKGNKYIDGAEIILSQTNDGTSSISLNADYINFEGASTFNQNTTISKDGRITTKNADITGTITAKDGKIGGWTIDEDKIFRPSAWDSDGISVWGTGAAANGSDNNPAFYAGFGGNKGDPWAHSQNKDSDGNIIDGPWQNHTKFYVTNAGFLRAKDAEIDGTITAANGSVANWTITGNRIEKDNTSSGGYRTGMQCTGTAAFYAGTNTSAGGSIASESASNFYVTHDGYLYCSNAKIKGNIVATEGYIGGWTIVNDRLENAYEHNIGAGAVCIVETAITPYGIEATIKYDSNNNPVIESVEWGEVARATQYYNGIETSESDINVKNSISAYTSEYEALFDNLQPCRYKYNHGTSDRYHTGFIAQEVVSAIESAGLTTQDFAGVVRLEEPNINGSEWLLRRDEFVALNTWQIQKAKVRIAELESRVAELEKLIKTK